ncbi:MAG: RdgB/HAM1 family non-canonical purine NTP pyrophosphatase [Candidatus Latescibacteria bacterium]|nr:RdgB/HAM1 family non-canonical purine NTP pyrophosphatase [Candidatus Latescibacterota bacterium]
MPPTLLIATGNAGKLREFSTLLAPLNIAGPAALDLDLEVEEDGTTFAANALLKARAFAQAGQCIALADDSGLEIDALDGAPGVYSARYGGPGLDDAQRCQLVLEQLASVPPAKRQARFRCCLAATAPDGRICHAEGTFNGHIALAPAGSQGFGYDPVFYLPQYDKTLAQLSRSEKNRRSHRGQAIAAIRPLLHRTFPELGPAPA